MQDFVDIPLILTYSYRLESLLGALNVALMESLVSMPMLLRDFALLTGLPGAIMVIMTLIMVFVVAKNGPNDNIVKQKMKLKPLQLW